MKLIKLVISIVIAAGGAAGCAVHPAPEMARSAPLDAALERSVGSGETPFAVGLVVSRGALVYVGAAGDAAPGRPADADTIVRLDSLTKPLTAAAVMQLADAGALTLDDPVAKFLPAFAALTVADGNARRPIREQLRIRHLLSHTGGLAGYSPAVDALWNSASNRDFADGLAALPLRHEPGAGFQYGNAYEVLPAVIEAASGMPFDEYMSVMIFEPIGMTDSAFIVPAEKRSRYAALFDRNAEGALYVMSAPDAPETEAFPSGGGGVKSTVGDYLKFAQMLARGGMGPHGRVLSAAAVEAMTRPQVTRSLPGAWQNDYAWGYGLSVRELIDDASDPRSARTFGWSGGYGTLFWVDPEADMIGIVVTQMQWGNDYDLREQFRDAAYKAYKE